MTNSTLLSLIPLTVLAVCDAYAQPLRIVQLDLARQMETTAFVSNYIDCVSAWGFDTLQLYLEARVGTKTFSLPEGERYTAEQMKAIVEYAAAKGMTIVPVVSLLGHAEQFFRHPGYEEYAEKGGANARLGNRLDTFCLSNPKTRVFLSNYLKDLAEIFPGPWFHAGFDEAWNSGTCDLCRDMERRDELFGDCIAFAHDELSRLGKRMWMWDDFFAFHTNALDRVHRDIVMCHWCYDTKISPRGTRVNFAGRLREDMLAKYAKMGFATIPATWHDPGNIRTMADYARHYPVFGTLITQWEDLMPNFHGGSLPRVLASSLLWENPSKWLLSDPFEEAVRRLLPSLSETEVLAAVAILENPDNPLAVETLRGSSLRPGRDEVPTDPLCERALIDDIFLRGEAAVLKAEVEAAKCRMRDVRRTVNDVRAAKDAVRGTFVRYMDLAERRGAERRAWRRGCSPDVARSTVMDALEQAKRLLDVPEAVAPKTEKTLEINFVMVDFYGIPFWEIYGKFGGEWREIAKLDRKTKPGAGDWAAYEKKFPFEANELPSALRIVYHGYGHAGISHVAVEDREARLVPKRVLTTEGDVLDPECVLVDDWTAVWFGCPDYHPAFFDNALAEKRSILEVELAE